MIAVIRLIFNTLSSSASCVIGFVTDDIGFVADTTDELKDVEKALGIKRPKPATSIRPEPTSLIASSKSCSSRFRPPTKKQEVCQYGTKNGSLYNSYEIVF